MRFQELRCGLITEHLAERDCSLIFDGQRLHKEALVDVIDSLLDMLNVRKFKVAELAIAPNSTALEERVR